MHPTASTRDSVNLARPCRLDRSRRCASARVIERSRRVLAPALAMLAIAGDGAAQTEQAAAGLHGVVVDARTAAPLAGASVSLERLPAGSVVVAAQRPGGFVATSLNVTTAEDGRYAFDALTPGEYRLRVTRLGYRPATFDVHYDGPADPRISVGLEVEPIELEPVEVRATALAPTVARRSSPDDAVASRIAFERSRQERFLEPDTRVITGDDMVEAVTLGEADLFRVLHRLPGVTTEDDFSAEPWTRGSRWDETRVWFDGLPLYDPMHAGGILASINAEAVGSLTFHPGVRPSDAGDGAAGVVDLRSRSAAGTDRTALFGQLSVVSVQGSAAHPWGAGNGVSVTGRRTYIEELAAWDSLRAGESQIPYGFSDVSARWDQVLADSLKLEVSGLWMSDRITGDIPYGLKGARGEWGNTALRATLHSTLAGVRARLTFGETTFGADLATVPWDERRTDLDDAAVAATTHNRIDTDVTELTVSPIIGNGGATRWQIGARHVKTGIRYAGSAPWPYPDAANAGDLHYSSDAARYAYWGSLRRKLHAAVEVSAGLRLETSDRATAGVPDMALAPRLALAWKPGSELRLSAAAGRHFQYEQAVAATGFNIESGLAPGNLWVSAGNAIPALRSDLLTAGAELWLPGGWLGSVNVWMRSTAGRLSPSPDSGYVQARPALDGTDPGEGWVISANRAAGIEFGARKLAGRWTGSVAASLSRSRMTARGQTYDAPGQRTFELDAAVLLRAGAKTSVGAALTAMSGAAYTRFYAFRCTSVTWYCPTVDDATLPTIGFVEPAGAVRTAPYISLDLHVERTGTLFDVPFGFYGQVRNALARNNRAAYVGSVLECDTDGDDCVLRDDFADGFRVVPLIGIWIRR